MTPGAIFDLYFGIPAGAVWSNLIASLICVGVAWWRLHRQAVRQHAAQLAQAAKHHAERLAQADEHHKELKALAERHHQALKDHITSTAVKPLIEQMDDAEFERQLQVLMRSNPHVLDAFLRTQARRHGRPDWMKPGGR